MRNSILAIALLVFTAVSMSCSGDGSSDHGSGGVQAGGTMALGGTTASGGAIGSGGQPGTGGANATGGSVATGGTTTSGGKTGSGGVAGGAAGLTGSGGTSGPGATGGSAGQTGSGGTTGSGGAAAGGASGTSATGGKPGRDAGPDAPLGTGGVGAGGNAGTSGGGGSGGTGAGGTTGTGATGGSAQSAGCGKTPTLANGARTIQSSGKTRNYMIRIPANYDNNHPYPLVFGFHWNGGNMNDVDGGGTSGYTWSYFGLREQADNSTNSKMIFVAPDGNGGWPNSGGQDLTFVDDMLKLILGDLCVDTTRVFSMGFSYGGGMSFELACARASVFRAVAVYSGAQLSGCDGGKDPIAYIGFHSISDGTCNYSGGESLRNKFVTNNACTAQTPPKPGAGNGHVCTSFDGCKAGYPVRWCAFDGGGHTPAPVDGQSSASGGGDKTWTKAEAWKFFTQF